MPMYEFDCADCHKSFEELVLSGSDPQQVACPTCTSTHVSKRLSAFAVGGLSHSDAASASDSAASSCATGGCCSGGSCGW